MQIIIPMSGGGERFKRAGFSVPKPLIEVEGKPVIAHVIALFPGETDFLFICSDDHLNDPKLQLAETLKKYCPTGQIVGIAPHKLGPVHAVLQAADHIKPDQPTLVSYCDYSARWNYPSFKKMVEQTKCDGAVIGYTGFHPHMLRNHNYGYVQTKNGHVTDIREKEPYTDQPMSEIALCGAYYFRTGGAMLEAMRELSKHEGHRIDGEHYVSLVYKFTLAKGETILAFLLERFMQWGTPEDLQDYLYWSQLFHAARKPQVRPEHSGLLAMPMAGQGKRFADAGYKDPKPLIPVSGKPMALAALDDLPKTSKLRAVLRRDLPQIERLEKELPGEILMLDRLSEGQALTALAALDGASDDTHVTIAACDNGMIYNTAALTALLADPKTDVIVWGARGYPFAARKPQAYGWIDADLHGKIVNISVKQPLKDPTKDPIVIGTFTFRRAGDFRLAVKRMMERQARINNEYYIDTAINDAVALGLNTRLFAVDYYRGWGTPEELQTYLYWQDCFKG